MSNELMNISGDWNAMTSMAKVFIASGLLPQGIKSPEQALLIMWQGRELGIQPLQALSTINVIQGKPTISPQLMLALIERSGQLQDISIDSTNERAIVTMTRRGRTPHTFAFSIQDANAMGLSSKDNYKKQAKVMLQWRAVAGCARAVFPDVILGLYTFEEMGADVSVRDDGGLDMVSTPAPVPTMHVLPAVSDPTLVFVPPGVPDGESTFQTIADWHEFSDRMKAKYATFKLAPFADVFGVNRVSDIRGTIQEAEAKVEAWADAQLPA